MKMLHKVSFILLVIGGLNWLSVGLGTGDLVYKALGSVSNAATIVYVLVGLAAIAEVVTHKQNCKNCQSTPTA